jgi:predicted transcriptional regulator
MTTEFKSWDELSDLEQAQAIYWDMHKDAYGVRPRCIDTSSWTIEDFEAEFVILNQAIADAEIERKASEENAVVVFEQRIQSLIKLGAKDRATAMRWIHEAEDTMGDDDYLAYTLGLPYQYFRKAA